MKTSLAPFVSHSDPKGRKFMDIVGTAYDGGQLTEEEAQRLNETPGLAELVGNFIAANRAPKKFKDEEVKSSYGYLSGYKPKGIVDQTNRLQELFSGLGYANQDLLTQIEKGEVELPKNAEGWFAIPNWMKNSGIFGVTYSEALLKVLSTIAHTRNGQFQNYREGELDEKWLRQSVRSQQFWKDISEAQGNPDILIVSAQFGIRHRGRSVRRAREVFASNEFGFGAFAIGCMLLTHPKRLEHYDDLWVDCSGDEFSPDGDGEFSRVPCFLFGEVKVKFGTIAVGRANGRYGTASGFFLQS